MLNRSVTYLLKSKVHNTFAQKSLSRVRQLFRSLTMENSNSNDHMQKTAEKARQMIKSTASVTSIEDISPTVKHLYLKVAEKNFNFQPGQWVDFYAPGVNTVGGFSMCSSPKLLMDEQCLELAVKTSPHPPADWVHTKCKAGSDVEIQVGGDFVYQVSPGQHDILLIAGGVGVNPLLSMWTHLSELENTGKVHMMYTASEDKELLFKERIIKTSQDKENFSYKFFVTQKRSQESGTTSRRIQKDHIKDVLQTLDKENLMCFICGPTTLIDAMCEYLVISGVSPDQIKYEKWW